MGIAMPKGGQEIFNIRKSGKRPADIILISNDGALNNELNPIVIVETNVKYDWRFLIGLPFVFFGKVDESMLEHMENVCKALKGYLPTKQMLWDSENQSGVFYWYLPDEKTIHLHTSEWLWEFSFSEWSQAQNNDFNNKKVIYEFNS